MYQDVSESRTGSEVISGSDGRVTALRDAGDRAEVVWEVDLGAPAGPPLPADVNGDGKSEILVGAADGVLYVLGHGERVKDEGGRMKSKGPQSRPR